MEKIQARTLLTTSTNELWETLRGRFIVEFDDGELESTWKELVFSSYGWDFHRKYPATALLKKHHIRDVLGSGRLSVGSVLKFLGNIVWSVYDAHPGVSIDVLARETYEKTNHIYNELSLRLETEVSSIDIIDFIKVTEAPMILEANNTVEPTQESITHVYAVIDECLKNDPVLYNNPLAKAARSGVVKKAQLYQCIGPRGFATDTDSTQFYKPVLRGFVDGLRLFYDSLIESRSAAKALLFSKKPLQDTEYFSRRLQLMDQIVQNLHPGDCGSTTYLHWEVRDKQYDDYGKEIFGGDLPLLIGKNYMGDDGKLRTIQPTDKHLIGQRLKVRGVMHCQHPDPYGICATCFGELALSVPENTNIGHMNCTSMTQKSSQSVLSVKHLDASAAIERILIDPLDRPYLSTDASGMAYLIEKSLPDELRLVIDYREAKNITDVREVKNVRDLNITRVSALSSITLVLVKDGLSTEVPLEVGLKRRPASMTYPLLEHIRAQGWDIDAKGNYVINLTGYDRTKPFLTLPLRHYNMADHSKDIAAMLEARMEDLIKRDEEVEPSAFLVDLYDLVNSRLDVNLAILEVVLYGVMIVSADQNDYHLPKPWTKAGLGVKETLMSYRSLSAMMAYQGHKEVLTDPKSFLVTDRPDHPLDALLMPFEMYHQVSH